MLTKHERYYDLGKHDAWYTQYFGASKPKNAMRGIRSISGPPNQKTRCVVYAVFRALETLRMCGSCHAGHIRRGRPSMHFLRVYAPAEPITMIIVVMTIVMMIIIVLIELKLPSRQMQERLKHEPWHLGGYSLSVKGASGQ